MATHIDKVVITHRAALREKYGPGGFRRIRDALRRLASTDEQRGLSTRVVLLDDGPGMRSVGGAPVVDHADAAAVKEAVDAVAAAFTPHYLVLVGAPDVVPQQLLRNPTPDDDLNVPSDLPYACPTGPSDDPARFVGATRVVGRLPDLPNAVDPSFLLKLIGDARTRRSFPAADHLPVFALSAEVWRASTTESVRQLAGDGSDVRLSPPDGPSWEQSLTSRRMHFINCHGDEADFRWYGDDGTAQPVALNATMLPNRLSDGTVVAAECCFGAAHYDPTLSGQMTVAATYLSEGACGVFGSSTLAYGDTDRTTSADLITRFFLSAVLEGASLGRAALQARLRFVQELGELDPYDLKTLAQFDLLGDPAAHPVVSVAAPSTTWSAAGTGARRRALRTLGGALGSVVPASEPDGRLSTTSPDRLAADYGFAVPPEPVVRQYGLRPAPGDTTRHRVTYTVLAARPSERRRVAVVVREEPGRPPAYRTVHSR